MKISSLLPSIALGLALLCSACGGGGGDDASSEEATVQGAGVLSNASLASSMNIWPTGSTVNQVVMVGLVFGEGTMYSNGIETGSISSFTTLVLSAATGLADTNYAMPSSYSYNIFNGQVTLHGLDVFGSGSPIDIVLQLTTTSDTTMSASLTGDYYAIDSSGVGYRIALLQDVVTIRLQGYVDDGSGDDAGSLNEGGVVSTSAL